ncbi:ketosteroid isomerase-related protein [Oharaeibacter diazotrophicus]|uniref:Steroid delta-isomerase-like uncharacterized protein n=1 Tax=Oharaeibacter diazotrophicus TaxID=1920512 RepID=A0A4R6R9L9_9HYPH|nr:ketosteroid isomerase-related protein [Oharaeibacter diazotrophicus]TDP82672.1 steroid delta-isomerase-like uncharacterized protein [Oharaeibacter diazotrophicus]BBE72566.1 SnoaL-like domain protein [Pleomorphomonas sp. SM30]GLS76596.1 hypothetical protein GCM10007904_19330 [Oharaeibacter diazotrophicus]
MAADETIALVRRYFEALDARSIAGVLATLDPEVVHDVNQGGRRIGREAFESFLIHMARCYRETCADLVVFASDDGGRAAAEYTLRGTYEATEDGLPEARGQRYSIAGGSFFAIEDGLIVRVTSYYNLEDWLARIAEG